MVTHLWYVYHLQASASSKKSANRNNLLGIELHELVPVLELKVEKVLV